MNERRIVAVVIVEFDPKTGGYCGLIEHDDRDFETESNFSTVDGCLTAAARLINEHRFAQAKQREVI
jgi:hypothetical protein